MTDKQKNTKSNKSNENDNDKKGEETKKESTIIEDNSEYVIKNGKTYKRLKPVPNLKEMLQNGAPGEIPYDKKDFKGKVIHMLTGPVTLAIVFLISLVIWHNAPHGKSKHAGYKLPGFNGGGSSGFDLMRKIQEAQKAKFKEMDEKMKTQVEEAQKRAAAGEARQDQEF